MTTRPGPGIVTNVEEIADQIRMAGPRDGKLGNVVFLIGAGCSISAGIPGALDIAKIMVREIACIFCVCDTNTNCEEAYQTLVDTGKLPACLNPIKKTIDWYKVYDEMFRIHYNVPDRARRLFANLVEKGAINWAHLCLGELIAHKLVSTVLTTNFDRLVLSGIVRTGLLPVICDGIESLNRIRGEPRHPQLIEIHGSLHTYMLRNSREDRLAVRNNPGASAKIQGLLQDADTFIAIGYGGREEGVMDLLIEAAKDYPDKYLFWVDHSADYKSIPDKVSEFLASSKNGRLFPGQDADRFFLLLCQSLNVGVPTAILEPLDTVERLIKDVWKSNVDDPDIQAVIDAAITRVKRLREHDKATRTSEIREKRLAGDPAQAYSLAIKEFE